MTSGASSDSSRVPVVSDVVGMAGPAQIASALREHALFFALIIGYIGVGVAARLPGVLPLRAGDLWQSLFLQIAVVAGLTVVGLTAIVYRLRVRTPDGERIGGLAGWRAGWHLARQGSLSTWRLAGLVLVLFAVSLFGRAFVSWKSAIPAFHPFSWDVRLGALDRWLHGGTDPWVLLHPVLGHRAITRLLDLSYLVWHVVLIGFVLWQAWSPRRRVRMQFLLTFVLSWIVLGTITAIGLSSAGPCYYGRVTGLPDPYLPLLQYLQALSATTPLTALEAQEWLWVTYITNAPGIGISAMPSMHVAIPVLYVLTTWRIDRRLCAIFGVFAVLMLLGSIHLGWHYAVDGYVSILGVCVLWAASGRYLSFRLPDDNARS
jgi:hypothetical protein